MKKEKSKSKKIASFDVFYWFLEFMKWLGIFRNLWWLGQQIAKYVSTAFRKLANLLNNEYTIEAVYPFYYISFPEMRPSDFPSLVLQAKYLWRKLLKNKLDEGKLLILRSKKHGKRKYLWYGLHKT